jgi:hypothetical protein
MTIYNDLNNEQRCRLKGQCQEIFYLWGFHRTIPSRPLIHAAKYFRILLRICRDINEFVWSRAMLA